MCVRVCVRIVPCFDYILFYGKLYQHAKLLIHVNLIIMLEFPYTIRENLPYMKAKHTGVQFSEESEELLLAGLLYHVCCYPDVDLSVVRFSEHELKVDVKLFMEDKVSIRFKRETGPFCKSKEEDVMVYCICP